MITSTQEITKSYEAQEIAPIGSTGRGEFYSFEAFIVSQDSVDLEANHCESVAVYIELYNVTVYVDQDTDRDATAAELETIRDWVRD